MSQEKPILDALEVSVLLNRRDQPGQVAWTEWRANVASGCPATPGSIVMTGASGKIDPCLLPSTTGLLIEVGGVPVVTQTVLNFIAGTGITIVPDAFGGVTFTATGSSSTVSVNGTTVSNPDFNNTTPAAPNGSANVLWQTDGSGHVSAYYLTPQLPITFSPVAHEWLNSYNATTGLFTATQPSASDLSNGVTGTGAVVLANSPTLTGTALVQNIAISGTLADSTNSVGTAGYILSSTGVGTQWIPNTSGSTSFSAITSGTNTIATMVVGSGASLSFSGSGVVNANQIYGVSVSSTPPLAGQVLTATSATTAQWNTPASSSGNFVQATVTFFNPDGPEETTATVTLTGLPWVTSGSIIVCNPFGGSTPDHGPEDAFVEDLAAYATNLVPGVGFDIQCYAPRGTWGRYLINATGQ